MLPGLLFVDEVLNGDGPQFLVQRLLRRIVWAVFGFEL